MTRLLRRFKFFADLFAPTILYGASLLALLAAMAARWVAGGDDGLFSLGLAVLLWLQASASKTKITQHVVYAHDATDMINKPVSLWTAAGWTKAECLEVQAYCQAMHAWLEHNGESTNIPPKPAVLR